MTWNIEIDNNIAASDERRSGNPANRPIRHQLDVKC
jgi:hypothetical protein